MVHIALVESKSKVKETPEINHQRQVREEKKDKRNESCSDPESRGFSRMTGLVEHMVSLSDQQVDTVFQVLLETRPSHVPPKVASVHIEDWSAPATYP